MFKTDSVELLLILLIPGFISIKVYQLFIPTDKIDFSKNIYEIIGFSSLNFAFFYWLIVLMDRLNVKDSHSAVYYVVNFSIMFVSPVVWPLIYVKILKSGIFRKYIIHPVKLPWDQFFSKADSYWVVIHLKDGQSIGGKYGTSSFTSTYPAKEQIYIEEVWMLNEDGGFQEKIKNTAGMMILGEEISRIEFIK